MKSSRKMIALAVLGLALAGLVPSNLVALGPAPYPTGAVKFDTYIPEPGAVQVGESSRFQFGWEGIKAAEATMSVRADAKRPGWICVSAAGKTIGSAAALYRAEDSVSSCMTASNFKTDVYSIRIRETLDNYDMVINFNHQALTADRTKKTPRDTTIQDFKFSNAYCPIGVYLLIRSLPWKPGDERRFEVIDGYDRDLIVIKALNYETIKVPAGTFKALKIQPSLFVMPKNPKRETAQYWEKQKSKDRKRLTLMKSFSMWMMVDPPRQILRVRTDVYFGHVDMDLMEYKAPPNKT